MNIIIAGDGKVGQALTRQLSSEGHDITLIDSNFGVLEQSIERYDVMSVHGNCASMEVLNQAGVADAELLIAATSADEINLLCCTTAHALNPKLHTIARIRNPEYTEQIFKMRDLFGLSMVINPEKMAAVEIERLLSYPGFLRRDTFAKGRTEIVELRVEPKSKLCSTKLMDMRSVVGCQVLVCAVIRSGQAMTPKGDFVFQEGDRLYVTALSENLATLLKNLGIVNRPVKRVLICGGGRVSFYLAKFLLRRRTKVTIIDNRESRCRELSEQLPEADIIFGDCSNQELLESENISGFDAAVNLTGMDELNTILALYESSRGLRQVISKIGHMDNQNLISNLSLGSIISPKELCSSNIARYVRAMQNQTGAALSVHSIADGMAEAVEFMVDEKSKNCGKPLKSIRLKPNVLVVSISHGSRNEIANGDSVYEQGDIIVAVSSGGLRLGQLNDIFA